MSKKGKENMIKDSTNHWILPKSQHYNHYAVFHFGAFFVDLDIYFCVTYRYKTLTDT